MLDIRPVALQLAELDLSPLRNTIERHGFWEQGQGSLTWRDSLELYDGLREPLGVLASSDIFKSIPQVWAERISSVSQALLTTVNNVQNIGPSGADPWNFGGHLSNLHEVLVLMGLVTPSGVIPKSGGLTLRKRAQVEDHERSIYAAKVELEEMLAQARLNLNELAAVEQRASQTIEVTNQHRARAELAATQALELSEEARELTASIHSLRTSIESSRELAEKAADAAASSRQLLSATVAEVAALTEKLDTMIVTSNENVKSDREWIAERNKTLAALTKQIEDRLVKATNAGLFHAFDTRRKGLALAVWLPFAVGFLSLIVGGSLAFRLLNESGTITTLSTAKALVTAPLFYAAFFALRQFTRERRLQEEYAFRSAISVSLEPYRQLIVDHCDMETPEGQKLHNEFIVGQMNRIFDSPTDRVFGEPRFRQVSDTKIISSFLDEVKKMSEIVKLK
ncbi:hypothetical protein [Fimbriimonas ginsengisoli]|uniref:Uncharacterized protein n=1 Tax=Fimbriimonas ginsengisoli Gsoil 348 TaxID=661478 RepID=A0A068NQE4_FIMGI|nr:hypothetical protein [Fimbriimonas ginsengisoli]AIE85636.1 hypothetical protein OP10G_2268 [Fimbriimonas ginsengisoli Gsoil 348]